MLNYMAQGIGFLGMILVFAAFQNNDKKKILLIQACAGSVFAVHFMLLGAYTGAVMNATEVVRNLLLSKGENLKHKKVWIAVFMILFTLMGSFTWQNAFSILPIFAMNLSNIAFSMKNSKLLRLCYLPVSISWLIYNITAFSIAGIMTEVFCLISMTVAFIRFDILKKQKSE